MKDDKTRDVVLSSDELAPIMYDEAIAPALIDLARVAREAKMEVLYEIEKARETPEDYNFVSYDKQYADELNRIDEAMDKIRQQYGKEIAAIRKELEGE